MALRRELGARMKAGADARPGARLVARLRRGLEGREFLKHVLILMSGTAVAQVVPLLASPIISRLYSPHEVGVYTAFMSLVGILMTIATWRYDVAIVLPTKPEDARALVKVALGLSSLTCLLVGLGLVLAAGTVSEALGTPDLKPWLVCVGLVAWASSQVSVYSYWCNRNKDYRLMGSNRVLQAFATTVTQLGGGAMALGTTGLIVSTLIGQFVGAGTLLLRTRKAIFGKPTSALKGVMVEHRKMPLINAPIAALDTVRLNGTQLIISAFFSAAALGQFGQAWRLVQTPMGLINSSLAQVFFQRLAVTPRGGILRLVVQIMRRSALIGIVPFALIWVLSPPLVPFIFGARWADAGLICAGLVPWLYVNFITSPISLLFIVVRRQGVLLWFALPFTAMPLWVVWTFHANILTTVTYLSWTMVGLLCVFILLALWVARSHDRTPDPDPDLGLEGPRRASSRT
jgi:stage V sporulation protein B